METKERATIIQKVLTPDELMKDTNKGYLLHIDELAENDARGLHESDKHYSDSWKRRGGVGAFMMMARKWDRIENLMTKINRPFDIFWAIASDQREEGVIDDIRDLRRYLNLVEAEMLARGSSRKASKLPAVRTVVNRDTTEWPKHLTPISEEDLRWNRNNPPKDYNADQ